MGKSTSVKREIRFKQWIQQVKEYNERPDGMSMSAWCLAHYLLVVRLSYHQISFFPRSYSYYNRNMHFELIKLLENQELLNECGIYFCTGIYFFKLAREEISFSIRFNFSVLSSLDNVSSTDDNTDSSTSSKFSASSLNISRKKDVFDVCS